MIILRKDFKVLNSKKIYSHHIYYQSWYSPIFLKTRTQEDDGESCCITFQVRKDSDDKKYIVLANILMPNRLSPYNVITYAKNLSNDFTHNSLNPISSLYSQKCVIIPANENEPNSFASEASKKNIPIQRLYIEKHGGDLEGLIHRAVNLVSQNRFCLVVDSKNDKVLRPIDDRFLDMIIRYPSRDSYALSYAWAQGLVYGERNLGLFEKASREKRVPGHNFYGVET